MSRLLHSTIDVTNVDASMRAFDMAGILCLPAILLEFTNMTSQKNHFIHIKNRLSTKSATLRKLIDRLPGENWIL